MATWTLYVVKCRDGSLYTGITTDLDKRLKRHNEGRAAKYTRARKPVKLAYSIECDNESHARKQEAKIKQMSREKKLKLIRS